MPVLIYDGECNMCSRFIQFIVDLNKNPHLKITDFNSRWTAAYLRRNPRVDSMIFIIDNKVYIYSDAVLHLLASTHFLFQPLLMAKVIPKVIRDGFYKFVAKRRKRIMKNQSCPVMNQKARDMFLP